MSDGGEPLARHLSESLIMLLAWHNEGAQVAAMVEATDFEPPYDEFAARLLTYWKDYARPPGKDHLDDLFDDILGSPTDNRKPLFQNIIYSIYKHAADLNPQYVVARVGKHVQRQVQKRAIMEAGQRIVTGGDGTEDDVETILSDALQYRPISMDPGIIMGDPDQAWGFLDREDANDILSLGIPELDNRDIAPTKGELFGFMGPRGSGKSMFCTHVAVQAAWVNQWRALDISLEMSEAVKAQRILQRMFAIVKRQESYTRTRFTLDDLGRITGLTDELVTPAMNLKNPDLRSFLRGKYEEGFGTYLNLIRVKRFSSGGLTVPQLKAYLDNLDRAHHWQPDVLIVDYPGLMSLNKDNYRLDLMDVFVKLRGLAIERNMAVVVPHQANRAGEQASTIKSHHASEDISLFATADVVLTLNATDAEKKYNLARLYAAKVRNDQDKMTVAITQNYATAQFVLDSGYKPDTYDRMIADFTGEADDGEGTAQEY